MDEPPVPEFDSWVDGEDAAPPQATAVPTASLHAEPRRARSLALVESAFFASTTSLLWLVNAYVPPGPLLRFTFPLPIALAYRRWGPRAAMMTTVTTLLLLSVLMGPPRGLIFLPYGLMALQLGICWQRRAGWPVSIALGTLLAMLGVAFRYWIVSLLLGEDVLQYVVAQMAGFLDWLLGKLGLLSQPSFEIVAGLLIASVALSSLIYMLVIHLIAWSLFERLGSPIPPPPRWVGRIFARW